MGTKVLAAADTDTKPNYTVSTVLAASVAIIDGQFAAWVGNAVTTNVEAYNGLGRCKEALREQDWPNPTTGIFNSAVFNTITGVLTVALGAILPTVAETDVCILQGLDFTQAADSNSGHAQRMSESWLESAKAA
jgi:hypothetical protein